eukprot:Rhum_TRINITY_DN19139_c0_g1::Rhum_TRINITY_DN19139_c0_g1_i1::g.169263::m.169263
MRTATRPMRRMFSPVKASVAACTQRALLSAKYRLSKSFTVRLSSRSMASSSRRFLPTSLTHITFTARRNDQKTQLRSYCVCPSSTSAPVRRPHRWHPCAPARMMPDSDLMNLTSKSSVVVMCSDDASHFSSRTVIRNVFSPYTSAADTGGEARAMWSTLGSDPSQAATLSISAALSSTTTSSCLFSIRLGSNTMFGTSRMNSRRASGSVLRPSFDSRVYAGRSRTGYCVCFSPVLQKVCSDVAPARFTTRSKSYGLARSAADPSPAKDSATARSYASATRRVGSSAAARRSSSSSIAATRAARRA